MSSDARAGGIAGKEEGCLGGGGGYVALTEDSSGGVITGETGLAHTRTRNKASV
jgi:hypothetical protein